MSGATSIFMGHIFSFCHFARQERRKETGQKWQMMLITLFFSLLDPVKMSNILDDKKVNSQSCRLEKINSLGRSQSIPSHLVYPVRQGNIFLTRLLIFGVA